MKMTAFRLQSIDPEKNRYREYSLTVQPGLFGDYCLTIHWGRIGTQGDFKDYWHSTEEEAIQHSSRIVKKRLVRGYRYTRDSKQL